MDEPPHKIIQIGIMHIISGASGMFLGTFVIWAVWGSIIGFLSALTSGVCSVCCLLPVVLQIYLVVSTIINMLAGIGLLVTQNKKFIRLSKIAAIFAVINIICGDIIGMVMGIVIFVLYNDEKIQDWLEERLEEDW